MSSTEYYLHQTVFFFFQCIFHSPSFSMCLLLFGNDMTEWVHPFPLVFYVYYQFFLFTTFLRQHYFLLGMLRLRSFLWKTHDSRLYYQKQMDNILLYKERAAWLNKSVPRKTVITKYSWQVYQWILWITYVPQILPVRK